MTGIAEKIKEVFTGHNGQDEQHHDTSSASAATTAAAATTRPHDPEYDAKKATSEAGNYPHWRTQMPDSTTTKTPHGAAYPGLDTDKSSRERLGEPATAAGIGAGTAALGSGALAASSSTSTTTDKGAHHHINEFHNHPHDVEKEAKEATSAAGNHPYWGKLPATGEEKAYQQHDEHAATTGPSSLLLHDTVQAKDSRRDSGFATGAAGLGAAGLGYAAARHHNDEKDKNKNTDTPFAAHNTSSNSSSTPQRDVPDRGREPGQGIFAQPDLLPIRGHSQPGTGTGTSTSTTSFPPKPSDNHQVREGGLAAATLGTGTLGSAYLTSKRKSDAEAAGKPAMSEISSTPAQAGPGSLNKDYTSHVHRSAAPSETPKMTNILGASTGLGGNSSSSSKDKPQRRDQDAFGSDAGRAFPLTQSGTEPYDTLGSSSYGAGQSSSKPGATILDTGAGASGVYSPTSDTNKLTGARDHSSSTPYGTTQPTTDTSSSSSSNKREKEILGAGAGAAGLAGAGYLWSHRDKNDKDNKDPKDDTKSYSHVGKQAVEQPSTHSHTTYSTTSPGQKHYEMPRTADQTNTSTGAASHMGPTSTSTSSSGGVRNTVIGAGSPEHQNTGTYSSMGGSGNFGSGNAVTVGPHSSEGTSTSALGGSAGTLGRSAPHDNHDREKQALAAAAAVGAGAGVYGAERKHRRDEEDKQRGGFTGAGTYNTSQSDSHGLPSHPASTSTLPHSGQAHAAAQQAWKDSNQPSSATSGTGDKYGSVEPGTAVYYGQGREHDQNPRSGESEKIAERAPGSDGKAHAPESYPSASSSKYSTGAGDDVTGTENRGGVEPGTAVYYGQGREHDQNPRSGESEKIAERALGSDGKPHAPASQGLDSGRTGHDQMASGHKMFSMPGSYPSASNKSGLLGGGSKVIHKCHQCGAENDISDYLKRDS